MRSKPPPRLEQARVVSGEYGSTPDYGMMGAFILLGPKGSTLVILASDGTEHGESHGWEHVSVSIKHRAPNWAEMCFVKDLFWEEEECVIQYHPPRSEHINLHPYCLHMWKPIGVTLPAPPSILVGPKT